MKDLRNYLVGIATGVKFRPNYSIKDHMGAIIDGVLYRKGSLFNYITFPFTSMSGGSPQTTLDNPQTGDKLIIDSNNLILDIRFSDKIPKEKSDALIEEFFKTVTQEIYKIVDIKEVFLLGVVRKYIINDQNLRKFLSENFKNIVTDDATSVNINFTKKIVLAESKIKKDLNDYENVLGLISITNSRKDDIFLQIDYQHIFDPKLESIKDIPYKEFIQKVDNYNVSIVDKWIAGQNVKKT